MMSELIKISFCGDIMCLKEQNEAILGAEDVQKAYDSIFDSVKPLLSESDYVVGNLETPICDSDFSSESICFNTPIEFLRACKYAGFDFLTTSNNHCLDRGINGIDQTIDNIDKIGLSHTGTYSTIDKSQEISVIDIKGLEVAFIAATFGTNSEVNGIVLPEDELWRVDLLKKQNKPARVRFNPGGEEGKKIIYDNVSSAAITNSVNNKYLNRLFDKIANAKEIADIVIVMPHIGGQYNSVPGNYTRYIVSEVARREPSLIVAGHPHVPLRLECINNILSAYSLGNFSFTPGVGYFIPNVLAEYGIIFHTYWNTNSSTLEKISFSIVKNIIGHDGVSRVVPANLLYQQLQSTIDKERLFCEAEAIAERFTTSLCQNPLDKEIIIIPPSSLY